MDVGILVPQGWLGEYDRWDARSAWRRSVDVARLAERVGFESLWVYDHFHTQPEPTDEPTFESFTTLAALASLTSRVHLGHVVACAGYRNPALVAKMIATLDVASGGRAELGLGAGWKRDEWVAYGYGFPETRDRLGALEDALAIATRMLRGGPGDHATYDGRYARVEDAINVRNPSKRGSRSSSAATARTSRGDSRRATPTNSTWTGCRRRR